MAHLQYFSPERQQLNSELMLDEHQKLWPLLAKYPPQEFELRLAEIAAYCDVVLDGVYTNEEINKLCEILTKKLYEKRTGIFVLNPVSERK